jgi:hypothetical protein
MEIASTESVRRKMVFGKKLQRFAADDKYGIFRDRMRLVGRRRGMGGGFGRRW